jgi:diaminohydroxyphosphoribosylaminopyrimidine deaminase / 5-amino-6-(5-phosphoribosylamino)uracil reductase
LPDHADKRRKLIILDRRRRVSQRYIDDATARGFDVEVADDYERALCGVGESGVLEVLVEAGPAVTDHVLATGLWDEHVRILQTDKQDKLEILTKGDAHVLRNH